MLRGPVISSIFECFLHFVQDKLIVVVYIERKRDAFKNLTDATPKRVLYQILLTLVINLCKDGCRP